MPALQLTLFGSFTASIDFDPITAFESNKVRALLVYLALEHRQAHERASLLTLLWPTLPDAAARRALSQALFNLRQSLRDDQNELPYLLVSRQSLRFHLQPAVRIDALTLEDILQGTHPNQNVALYQQAVDLYRAPLLDGFALPESDLFEQWLRNRRTYFHRQAMTAHQQLAEQLINAGAASWDQAKRVVEHHLTLEPWSEDAHGQLMRLLALGGQRSAALAQFEQCRQILVTELAVAPSPALIELYTAIKTGAFPAPIGLPLKAAPTSQLGELPAYKPLSALPMVAVPFVGREEELAQISAMLVNADCRLVTLIGPGGIGKTQLALQTVYQVTEQEQWPVIFVNLADVRLTERADAEELLLQEIANALELPFYGKSSPLQQIVAFLAQRHLLLLIDNFEPMITAADQLGLILQSAPAIKMLVTSRERLNLQEEWLFALGGLTLPTLSQNVTEAEQSSAVRLFAQSARRVDATFALSAENWAEVVSLCRLVEGMPLGIQLAAAWVRHLSLQAIHQEIATNADFLATSLRNVPQRHRSMRAVFDYSWQLLATEEQRALACLSIFPKSFDRAAAQAIANVPFQILVSLVDKSLLRHTTRERYSLHPLLRQFASDQLNQLPMLAAVARQRHAAWYANWVSQRQGEVDQLTLWRQINEELDNLRAGWHYALEVADHRLFDQFLRGHFYQLYSMHGWFAEGIELFRLAIATLQPLAEQNVAIELTLARLWAGQGGLSLQLSRHDQAQSLLQNALVVFRTQQQLPDLAFVLNALGDCAFQMGQYVEARQLYQESLQVSRQIKELDSVATTLNNLGTVSAYLHDLEHQAEARQFYQESLTIARQIGNPHEIARALLNLGSVAHALSHYVEARVLYEESLAVANTLNDRKILAIATSNLAAIWQRLGSYDEARRYAQHSLQIKREMGNLRSVAHTLNILGDLHQALQQDEEAQRYYREAIVLGLQTQALDRVMDALVELGKLRLKAEDWQCGGQIAWLIKLHPASEMRLRQYADQLLAALPSALPESAVAEVRAWVQMNDLGGVLQRVLATLH